MGTTGTETLPVNFTEGRDTVAVTIGGITIVVETGKFTVIGTAVGVLTVAQVKPAQHAPPMVVEAEVATPTVTVVVNTCGTVMGTVILPVTATAGRVTGVERPQSFPGH